MQTWGKIRYSYFFSVKPAYVRIRANWICKLSVLIIMYMFSLGWDHSSAFFKINFYLMKTIWIWVLFFCIILIKWYNVKFYMKLKSFFCQICVHLLHFQTSGRFYQEVVLYRAHLRHAHVGKFKSRQLLFILHWFLIWKSSKLQL